VLADIAHEFAVQVCGRREDAAVDQLPLDLAEPQLDLVQPGRVLWREVEADPVGEMATGSSAC